MVAERALVFATAAHAAVGQRRKYTGEPYIVHPVAVADLVRSVLHTSDMIAAAYLHDVVEDTQVEIDTIRMMFGRQIADMVDWLTEPRWIGNRKTRKISECRRLALAPTSVKTIKIADLIDNTKSIVANDPDFAKVYLMEKANLLNSLNGGDNRLLTIAWNLTHEGAASIGLNIDEV